MDRDLKQQGEDLSIGLGALAYSVEFNLVIQHYHDGGWEPLPTTADLSSYSVTPDRSPDGARIS